MGLEGAGLNLDMGMSAGVTLLALMELMVITVITGMVRTIAEVYTLDS